MKHLTAGLIACGAILLLSLNTFSQTRFEPGYLIDQRGDRKECLIRNDDWIRSPRTLVYKATATGDQVSMNITGLKEFGVGNTRFVCTEVKVDTSSQDPKTYSHRRAPEWDVRYVALKVLADGKATLFYYDDKRVSLYFYSVDGSPVEQLEYKSYLIFMAVEKYYKIGQNLNYINQLKENVSCGDVYTKYATNKFRYKTDFLVDYFNRYNICSGGEIQEVKQNKERFHMKVAPGVNLGKARVINTYYTTGEYSDLLPALRIGLDVEMVLPFRNNKWSIFVEPTYQSFKTTSPLTVEYASIELPVGVRHYFYLNDKLNIFLDGAIVFDFPIDYSAQVNTRDNVSFTRTQKPSYAIGLGAGYGRFTLEGRYYTARYRYDRFRTYESTYKQIALILGFRLF